MRWAVAADLAAVDFRMDLRSYESFEGIISRFGLDSFGFGLAVFAFCFC